MNIVLVRVDDRLVHGQVTVGWAQSLNIEHIVVCDDSLAASEWERNLYMDSVPAGLEVTFWTEKEYIENDKDSMFSNERTIVLVESLEILVRLVKNGVRFDEINVGGMHYKDNSKEVLPYVFLNSDDIEVFHFLNSQHINITCQDTPTAKKHKLSSILSKLI